MRHFKRTLVSVMAAGATAIAAATPAHAGALVGSARNCDADGTSARVFKPWLDPAQYVPAPGGDVESAAGWQLTGGAGVVAGNEPWNIRSRADRGALSLPAGSSATTAVMCVGIGHPTIRFFSKRTSGSLLNPLVVEVLFEGVGGAMKSLPIGVVLAGGAWQPTLPFPVVASLLPLFPGQLTPVQFRFTPVGQAAWQVDDLYVDPWRAC